MNTVSAIHNAVNSPSHEDVCRWHQAKAERGELSQNAARLRVTALTQLVSILGSDEPHDPESLLANLSDIARRWATKNQANTGTVSAYMSRAKAALTDFIEWKRDPLKFRFRMREASPDRQKSREKAKEKAAEPVVTAEVRADAPPVVPPAPIPPAGTLPPHVAFNAERRTFPMGQGRQPIVFELPSEGITVHDVKRFACHLLTLATDFDPTVPSHAQVFSIVSQRGE